MPHLPDYALCVMFALTRELCPRCIRLDAIPRAVSKKGAGANFRQLPE
jgi:hypothetical protein